MKEKGRRDEGEGGKDSVRLSEGERENKKENTLQTHAQKENI